MTIAETRREGMVQLDVEGRVDTNTSPELQKKILQAFQKGSTVTLNLEAVDYVSSSGLRALLIGQKTASSKGGSMKLINVRDSVRKVFDMTGFSQMLTIE
ncbi:STAS domain-containing protein [uncultured Acetatifactor sp.]|uniref:STAS domain-containing protein n=1 Tax=uncultured Acetatifactor sp. TaxID=1671927 RepID=UPI0025DDC088|nr:STAS domain-containing protein [uncultured Acetatifactor sp.]MCI8695176.1 STAS domain-containing protein [Lachnospiraceae bacterium]MCI9232213.1 STAS domain-containing protein [Lachnospiraceae bacterium]MCI9571306.1 STAS domain-containing protein [Lachnospiraceae bacterium]MCI9650813.1 STAS domain-containing protein [Lachnospiraceae bacterium]